jgi:putative membrane protein
MADAILTDAVQARISAAVRAAEATTSGEIYVVISNAADDFRFVPVLWAALLALVVPWPLLLLTSWAADTILAAQALVFVGAALLASHPAIRRRLVPSAIAADASRRAALAQFMAHGVHLTENRTGVLIYVALADRRVEIVADAVINDRVEQRVWDELADAVVLAARRGALADGIVAAVARAGAILTQHVPRARDDRNELPDRVVLI